MVSQTTLFPDGNADQINHDQISGRGQCQRLRFKKDSAENAARMEGRF